MLFHSIEFSIFFFFVFAMYWFLPHKWQNRFLLLASYVFYGFWDWRFLSLIFVSTIIDYVAANKIHGAAQEKHRKRWLLVSLLTNLGLLFFFKYFNFFISSFDVLLKAIHVPIPVNHLNIILPVGISFYTFQTLSYTIDVYRGHLSPSKKLLDFALYVSFFPQLVAGPIERATKLLPQVLNKRRWQLDNIREGGFLFFWGLFEKLFIASNMAKIVDPIFQQSAANNGSIVLIGLYAFAFQIFCDFDGYSNMAIGLAKTLGFDLMINFRCPYFAMNPQDFWRRWHISLSTWLRDYLYIPLGGNRNGIKFTYRNLMVTMVLGGLWHGAQWTFIIWGVFHGALLVGYYWIQQKCKGLRLFSLKGFIVDNIQRLFLFHLIILGWLFFRAHSMAQAGNFIESLVFHFDWNKASSVLFVNWLLVVSPLILVQIFQEKSKNLMILHAQHWVVRTMIYGLMIYLILGWGILESKDFIYFQF